MPPLKLCVRARSMGRAGPYSRGGGGPARFGSYFGSIYRTSSMPASGLSRCDCCHRLLFEYPIIFWTTLRARYFLDTAEV